MATIDKNINLLTDFGFKRFFGTEQYKKNLIHFLNAFLSDHIGPVTDIAYRQTEQLGLSDKEKRLVFDVFCSDQDNDRIIVEMQKASQEFLKNRIIIRPGLSAIRLAVATEGTTFRRWCPSFWWTSVSQSLRVRAISCSTSSSRMTGITFFQRR